MRYPTMKGLRSLQETMNLNVVYEFWKRNVTKEGDNYIIGDYNIYNDCGCKKQETGESDKLCDTGKDTYWSGSPNNWILK